MTALSIGTVILGALHYYVGLRLIGGGGLRGAPGALAWIILWLLLASIPLSFLGMRAFPHRGAIVRTVALFWIGVFWLALSAVVLTDIARAIYLASGSHLLSVAPGPLQSMVVVALVLAGVGVGTRVARSPARLDRLTFPIPHLGKAFDGFRIIQLSDLHVTESLNGAFVQSIVDRVNAMRPDMVAITGDLVDGKVEDLRPHVAPLSKLRAREGVFFVTGNHEYYFGPDEWEEEVSRLGITVLHNSHRVIQRGHDALVVAGVTDYGGGHFHILHESRPDLALSAAPLEAPRILLAHQPKSAAAASGHGVDLQLSGHTHGGQIFPFMLLVRLVQPVIRGLRRLHGVWVYTSRGTGYWGPPMRIGSPPEITEITLTGLQAEDPSLKRPRRSPLPRFRREQNMRRRIAG